MTCLPLCKRKKLSCTYLLWDVNLQLKMARVVEDRRKHRCGLFYTIKSLNWNTTHIWDAKDFIRSSIWIWKQLVWNEFAKIDQKRARKESRAQSAPVLTKVLFSWTVLLPTVELDYISITKIQDKNEMETLYTVLLLNKYTEFYKQKSALDLVVVVDYLEKGKATTEQYYFTLLKKEKVRFKLSKDAWFLQDNAVDSWFKIPKIWTSAVFAGPGCLRLLSVILNRITFTDFFERWYSRSYRELICRTTGFFL